MYPNAVQQSARTRFHRRRSTYTAPIILFREAAGTYCIFEVSTQRQDPRDERVLRYTELEYPMTDRGEDQGARSRD